MNIAEILKHKPKGTKLYDYLYDKVVEFDEITTDGGTVIWCERIRDYNVTVHHSYSKVGTLRDCEDGLQILLPSKQMRDWSKFAWQAGSFLMGKDKKSVVMFCDWASDDYTKFKGVKFSMPREKTKTVYDTCDYEDFDMEHYSLECYSNPTTGAFGFKAEPKGSTPSMESKESIPSTQSTWEPKPYDRVLVQINGIWYADILSHVEHSDELPYNPYCCIGGWYDKILPYNEETAKLIGTNKSLEDLE